MKKEKVVLAFSGGLDTSVILKWIQEEYGAEVIAYMRKHDVTFVEIMLHLRRRLDASEILRELRSDNRTARMPIALVAELFGSESGMGFLLQQAQSVADATTVFATCFAIVIIFWIGEKLIIDPLSRTFSDNPAAPANGA